jgi:hypothetical protein
MFLPVESDFCSYDLLEWCIMYILRINFTDASVSLFSNLSVTSVLIEDKTELSVDPSPWLAFLSITGQSLLCFFNREGSRMTLVLH